MASDRDGTNLIAVVDEALGEIKRSPRRSVCCTKAGDVLSIVVWNRSMSAYGLELI